MTIKRVLCPQRLRRVPGQFSWIDHRFVREDYINRCDLPALGLYLLLVTVADAQGLSYYSDKKVCCLLKLQAATLAQARRQLCEIGLIAYEKPLYQVLGLDCPEQRERSGSSQPLSLGEIFKEALEKEEQ